ncbi:MAG: 3-oxoadipate enol-lactonase 2 [Alphaproteobacteria bacterium MarineAlpha10_Bin3]|nr:MAG: 3-oxoadipate enol-lactonase 2 [Alphaproteobacteria bacterium MarineAlpha10_Bin3]PPR70152.1 MAG: 3-oxoadipate enol-lactonase 2 [Alphaproteobacteria bacterium MarineAlpha4_Bin1]
MPHATTDDGVKLYYEETGAGDAVLFIHEFADDYRGWEPQIRHFSRRYRCIVYNARGYPPSDVPPSPSSYSQMRAVGDALAVLDHLSIEKAHIVGLSMGGFCALHFGLNHPGRAISLVVGCCGYGAQADKREQFRDEALTTADSFESIGMAKTAERYALGPTRVQYQNKDPRGWREFAEHLAEHSAKGSANTMRGVQAERPSLYDLVDDMAKLAVPTLIISGDEDEPCLEPSLLMKRLIPSAGLVFLPLTGHAINLEEPDAFNRAVQDFLTAVEHDSWGPRDPRSQIASITGMK